MKASLRNSLRSLGIYAAACLSVAAHYPLQLSSRVRLECPVTILSYHKISPIEDLAWNVHPNRFERQMQYLASGGYCVMALPEYLRKRQRREVIRQRTVIVTFDDGYQNVYHRAYPILKRYGLPATLFLVVNLVGSNRLMSWDVGHEEYSEDLLPLTWEQISAMQDELVTFGSHSLNHRHLARLPVREMRREIFESKRTLEEHLGVEAVTFAYPSGIRQYGDFDARTRQAVELAGYRLACISEIGRNTSVTDLFEQRRIAVHDTDSLRVFAAKVDGAYDWMFWGQRVFQRLFFDHSVY